MHQTAKVLKKHSILKKIFSPIRILVTLITSFLILFGQPQIVNAAESTLIKRGLELTARGKPKDAEPLFRSAVKTNPKDLWARHYLAVSLTEQGKHNEAIEISHAIVTEASNASGTSFPKIESFLLLGFLYSEEAQFDSAEKAFRNALQINPNSGDGLSGLAMVLSIKGQLKEAEPIIIAAQKSELSAFGQEAIGRALLEHARYSEAEEFLKSALAQTRNDLRVRFLIGHALAEQGKYKESEEILRQVLTLRPSNPDNYQTLMELGRVLIEQEKNLEAEKNFRNAIKTNPKSVYARSHLGQALMRQDKMAEAIKVYQEGLKTNSTSFRLYVELAFAFGSVEKYNEAIQVYREGFLKNPTQKNVYVELGNALVEAGLPEEAVAAFRLSVTLRADAYWGQHFFGLTSGDPTGYPELARRYRQMRNAKPGAYWPHHHLGIVLAEMGEYKESKEAFFSAVKVIPESPFARHFLGVTLALQGNHTEAIEQFRIVAKLLPNSYLAYQVMGIAQFEQGDLFGAEKSFRKALEIWPNSNHIRASLGFVLEAQGKKAEARDVFKEILKRKPGDALLLQVKAVLDKHTGQ